MGSDGLAFTLCPSRLRGYIVSCDRNASCLATVSCVIIIRTPACGHPSLSPLLVIVASLLFKLNLKIYSA